MMTGLPAWRNQGLPPPNLDLPLLLKNQPIGTPWATFLHSGGRAAPAASPPHLTPLRPWGSSPEKGLLGASVPRNLLVWGRQGQPCCPQVHPRATHDMSSAGAR